MAELIRTQITLLSMPDVIEVCRQDRCCESVKSFIDFAKTLRLNISFQQKIANMGQILSYKAISPGLDTPSPIHVLLRA